MPRACHRLSISETMASSSQAATCNGGDTSSTADKDERAMWNRLLQVESQILLNHVSRRTITQPIEEIVIKAATSSKGPSISFQHQDLSDGFKSVDFKSSNVFLKWLDFQKRNSISYSPRMCLFLINCFVSDRQKKWELSFLKLFWRYSNGVSNDDLLLFLNKLADHYAPSHDVEYLEEFVLTNEERATFLKDCSSLDKASRFAKDFNEFSLLWTHGQKPQHWTQRDHTLHSVSSFESMKPLEAVFPFSNRFETAKECFDRLDLLKSITADLNLDESDTLASVLDSFKSPELQALHALKKEMELHKEVALQLEQLSSKHLHAYEELSKDQLDEEEKRKVVQEALYKKVKCLASMEKARVSRQVKLSSEDLLKWMVQKTGSACKEVEGRLKKAQSSREVWSKECTLCYLEFSKKRKRACLNPCGHASACIDCATKAWARKPCCPWCKARIQKPISIPGQIFL